jgi:hypothetical protein
MLRVYFEIDSIVFLVNICMIGDLYVHRYLYSDSSYEILRELMMIIPSPLQNQTRRYL